MPDFRATSTIGLPVRAVWDFHARPGAFQRLMPPWQTLDIRSWRGTLRDARLEFVIRPVPALRGLGVGITWIAQHDEGAYIEGRRFVDVMERGPASQWRHTHDVNTVEVHTYRDADFIAPHRCELDDQISYKLPLHPLGQLVGGRKFESDLRRMFAFRHARTVHDAARHARFAHCPRLRVVLTGSNGTIGSALLAYLVNAGHSVDRLVRREPRATGDGTGLLPGREVRWDPLASDVSDQLREAIEGTDAVIHLGGAGLDARRWSVEHKRDMADSRVRSTALLARAIAACRTPPATFMVASGVNIYQSAQRFDVAPLTETTPVGPGFLAQLARAWENAAHPARDISRVVHLRLGVVLSSRGGYLRALTSGLAGVARGLKVGVSRMGDADAIVPWVHIDDVLGAVEHTLHTPSLSGPLNIAAPVITPSAELLHAINRASGTILNIPAPAWLLRTLRGEMADAALTSQPVCVSKLISSGFSFMVESPRTAAAIEFGELHELQDSPPHLQTPIRFA